LAGKVDGEGGDKSGYRVTRLKGTGKPETLGLSGAFKAIGNVLQRGKVLKNTRSGMAMS